MEKKAKAKSEMLKELSNEMSDDMYSPMKDMIGKKGLKKVSVMSDSPEGLEKGLSVAEKIMKLKSKQSGESEMEDESSCKMCKGKGCPACESEEDESPEMQAADEVSEMSEDEMIAMYELLKEKLGKA